MFGGDVPNIRKSILFWKKPFFWHFLEKFQNKYYSAYFLPQLSFLQFLIISTLTFSLLLYWEMWTFEIGVPIVVLSTHEYPCMVHRWKVHKISLGISIFLSASTPFWKFGDVTKYTFRVFHNFPAFSGKVPEQKFSSLFCSTTLLLTVFSYLHF